MSMVLMVVIVSWIYIVVRCSVVSNSSATAWTAAHQAPLSMGFPRQEYWSGLPFPPPRDLPDPGIEPAPPVVSYTGRQILYHLSHEGSSLTTGPPGISMPCID